MCPLALSDCQFAGIMRQQPLFHLPFSGNQWREDASDPLSLIQETRPMHAPIKYFEKGLSIAANGAWVVFSNLNKIAPNPSITPKWSDKQLLKYYEQQKPPTAWLAARNRLALSHVHALSASGDSRRQERRQRSPQREGR